MCHIAEWYFTCVMDYCNPNRFVIFAFRGLYLTNKITYFHSTCVTNYIGNVLLLDVHFNVIPVEQIAAAQHNELYHWYLVKHCIWIIYGFFFKFETYLIHDAPFDIQVYSHGHNRNQQLGRKCSSSSPIPKMIAKLDTKQVKKVRHHQ